LKKKKELKLVCLAAAQKKSETLFNWESWLESKKNLWGKRAKLVGGGKEQAEKGGGLF